MGFLFLFLKLGSFMLCPPVSWVRGGFTQSAPVVGIANRLRTRMARARGRRDAQSFSHGWKLPALLTGEGGPSGQGIPRDARYKPGSGDQRIAFVPSLDLVVTRQTGSSGAWEFEEYLRRACRAILPAEKTGTK